MRRACQAEAVAALTDFRGEREMEGTAWPSILSLPDAVWRAMVANSRRIAWPGSKPEGPKQVIINANGEEEEVSGDPNGGKAQTKAAILNAAIRSVLLLHIPRDAADGQSMNSHSGTFASALLETTSCIVWNVACDKVSAREDPSVLKDFEKLATFGFSHMSHY